MGFIKLTDNIDHPLIDLLVKEEDWLLTMMIIIIAQRIRRVDDDIYETKPGEFFFSRYEYKKFNLKETQQNLIRRRLKKLIKFKIIEDTGKKSSENACIYKWLRTDFLSWFRDSEWKDSGPDPARTPQGPRKDSGPDPAPKQESNTVREKEGEREGSSPPLSDLKNPTSIEFIESNFNFYVEALSTKYNLKGIDVRTELQKYIYERKARPQIIHDYVADINLWIQRAKNYRDKGGKL